MKVFENKLHEKMKQDSYILLVAILTIFGTQLEISSGIWDLSQHVVGDGDEWWRPPHYGVYVGIAMTVTAAILGVRYLMKNEFNKNIRIIVKIIIIATATQIAAGYVDYYSHNLFGLDGYVSITHFVLETPLAFNAFAGFLLLAHISNQKSKNLIRFSIGVVIFSGIAAGFNFVVFYGGEILCVPIYTVLNYGCSIL